MAEPDFDTRAVEAGLTEMALRLKRNCEQEEVRLAEAVAERARQNAAPHRRTGAELDSIQVERNDEGGATVKAKSFREFGTSKMAPEPFMRPAIAEGPSLLHPPDFH